MLALVATTTALLAAHVAAVQHAHDAPILTPELLKSISAAGAKWHASLDQGPLSGITRRAAKRLMGVKFDRKPRLDRMTRKPTPSPAELAALPASFDARLHWPNCTTIRQIRDQSACGACWAFAAVESMSDRLCTYGVAADVPLSAQVMNSCCDDCGDGCDGGQIDTPWNYWTDTGLPAEACDPFSLPPCQHHVPNATNPCPTKDYPTPSCPRKNHCTAKGQKFGLWYGQNPSYIDSGDVKSIMHELVTNGPVQTAFSVYEDFLAYKGGVYEHKHGAFLGGHSVRIIGYDVIGGVDAWLVANSWGKDAQLNGTFYIRRGTDECGFEDLITFGEAAAQQ